MNLPKAYIFTDEDLQRLNISPGDKPDKVAELQERIGHLLKYPAMFVGNANDFNGILTLLNEYMDDLCDFCQSLDLRRYWEYYGLTLSIGPGSLCYHGNLDEGINSNRAKKTPEEFLEGLREYVAKFYSWLLNNRVYFFKKLELPDLPGRKPFEPLPLSIAKNHPELALVKEQVKEVIEARNLSMSHVFVEGPFLSPPRLEITVLCRPVNPEHSARLKAVELGFEE